MKNYVAEDIESYVRISTDEFTYGFLFRGVSDAVKHTLIPGVGRYLRAFEEVGSGRHEILKEEQFAFRVFTNEVAFFDRSHRSLIECLALAQHHGLPTRLLDWTLNPLAGLFFAVWTHTGADSCVYVIDRQIPFFTVAEERHFDQLIFKYPDVRAYSPAHISARIRAQAGVFTYHPDPFEPLADFVVAKIVIPRSARPLMRLNLEQLGVNEKNLFPDIQGLAQWLRWQKFDCATWCQENELPNSQIQGTGNPLRGSPAPDL